ncbi:MAG TPA: hypothetical protein VK570_05090 [Rubrivivax sp.]|jgi:hypothetical protein|nr:hypothetical protein [Rubrivivax sp.]
MKEPVKEEINHQTIKLLVGVIALSLGSLTDLFADKPLSSISASYYEGGWSQTFFVGFLFAIAAFLMAYNGHSKKEMMLAKVAAVAAAGAAMFPCSCPEAVGNCRTDVALVPGVHGLSAAILFFILAAFCRLFYQRAGAKAKLGNVEARCRQFVYVVCGVAILVSMAWIGLHAATGFFGPRAVFYGETAALISFGISWLTASRALPLLAKPEERPWVAPNEHARRRP